MIKCFSLLLLIALGCCLAGCRTYKSKQQNAETFYRQYPNQLAALCALNFPVKESDSVTITAPHPGRNSNYMALLDTLNRQAGQAAQRAFDDSLSLTTARQLLIQQAAVISNFKRAYVPCAPDTIFKTRIITKLNTAKADSLLSQNISLGTQNAQQTRQIEILKTQNIHKVYWIVALSITAVLLFAGLIYLISFKGIW